MRVPSRDVFEKFYNSGVSSMQVECPVDGVRGRFLIGRVGDVYSCHHEISHWGDLVPLTCSMLYVLSGGDRPGSDMISRYMSMSLSFRSYVVSETVRLPSSSACWRAGSCSDVDDLGGLYESCVSDVKSMIAMLRASLVVQLPVINRSLVSQLFVLLDQFVLAGVRDDLEELLVVLRLLYVEGAFRNDDDFVNALASVSHDRSVLTMLCAIGRKDCVATRNALKIIEVALG